MGSIGTGHVMCSFHLRQSMMCKSVGEGRAKWWQEDKIDGSGYCDARLDAYADVRGEARRSQSLVHRVARATSHVERARQVAGRKAPEYHLLLPSRFRTTPSRLLLGSFVVQTKLNRQHPSALSSAPHLGAPDGLRRPERTTRSAPPSRRGVTGTRSSAS
jgi:hypothetical protein